MSLRKTLYSLPLLLLSILFFHRSLHGQSVGINTSGAAPDPSAMLDVSASDKGVLIPRVQLNDVNTQAPITAAPVEGLLIYNSTGSEPAGYYYWDGAQWVPFNTGGLAYNTNFTLNGNSLEITDPNGTLSADLSPLADSTDNDSLTSNELNSSFTLSGNSLDLTDPGGTYSVDLSPYSDSTDADSVIGNETISNVNLTGSNILEIDEAGITHTEDLSSLAGGGGHWTRDAANGHLYPSNIGDSVAVGTNTPSKARFEVQGASGERVAHFEGNLNASTGIVRTVHVNNDGHTAAAKHRGLQATSVGSDASDGRAAAIYGKAGGRDQNVGIYGRLNSGETGSGVFGTVGPITAASVSDMTAKSYAGYFQGNVALTAALEDNTGVTGTAGQVLTSTGTGVEWQNPSAASDGDWDRDAAEGELYPTNSGDSVAIGLQEPTAELHIKGKDVDITNKTAAFKIWEQKDGDTLYMDGDEISGGLGGGGGNENALLLNHETSEHVVMATGAGMVGIGQGANYPSYELHVQTSATNELVRFRNMSTGNLNATGVYAMAKESGGNGVGGEFEGGRQGVHGYVTTSAVAFADQELAGVKGRSVNGNIDAINVGVKGRAYNSEDRNFAVHGYTLGQDAGDIGVDPTDYAVFGDLDRNGRNTTWAGYFNGDLETTGNLITPSDRKFKTDLRHQKNVLDRLGKLEVYSYRFQQQEYMNLPQGKQYGFVAQEVEQVFPSLVQKSVFTTSRPNVEGSIPKKEYKSLRYLGFIPLLTKAVQEQQKKLEKKEERIQELQEKVEKNDERLKQLRSELKALKKEVKGR